MTETRPKTDAELKMEMLCTQLRNFQAQRDMAQKNMVGARLNLDIMEPTIKQLNNKISELMRSGIKRFVVPEPEIETPEQQQIKPQVS